MKTVFITLFQGVEAKNLLRTGMVTKLLGEPDVRVVLFLRTRERAEYYRNEFFDPRIIYEAVERSASGWLDQMLARLKFLTLKTPTTDLRRRMNVDSSGNYLGYYAGLFANRALAHRPIRALLGWVDFYLVRDDTYAKFFEQYRPDLVFLAHLFDEDEISLLREAARRRVKSIGYINSWDKLTGRCSIRLLPDTLLVFNEIVKREAVEHADMAESKIKVVGIPQYDFYENYRPLARPEFMKKIGIESDKRFLLYAPMGETFSGADWSIVDLLHEWALDGSLGKDVNFLVRFQPNDTVNEEELRRRPWLRYDRPGTRFTADRGVDWDMNGEELHHLADTLFYMELLVCYASSVSVDAAVFGKPVINIDFELQPAAHLLKSPTQFYRMEHYAKALGTGGIRMVRSKKELLEWIQTYLSRPELDAEGRARLVGEQCGAVDGQAARRIADILLATVETGHA